MTNKLTGLGHGRDFVNEAKKEKRQGRNCYNLGNLTYYLLDITIIATTQGTQTRIDSQ